MTADSDRDRVLALLRRHGWIFPADVPIVGLDAARLAKLQLTGANIKNVAIKAAFHAAHDSTPVTMSHILAAARSEFAKLEMPFPELEMRTRG